MFRWLHHIASFFLFAAAIFLLVVSVSSPVANGIGFLRVNLDNLNNDRLVFGNWGYCVTIDNGDDACTDSNLGYDPIQAVVNFNLASDNQWSDTTQRAVRRVTKSFVLHPIACGISLFAFLVGVGANFCGSFCAALAAALSCAVTLAAMIIDFWLFGKVRSGVNDHEPGSPAHWGSCVWLCMMAFLCSFTGMVLMLLTCCTRDRGGQPPRRAYGTKW